LTEVLDLGSQRVVLPEEPGDFGGALGVLVTERLVLGAKIVGHLLERLLLLFPAFAESALGFPVLHAASDLLSGISM
jgi:hypothetical protein